MKNKFTITFLLFVLLVLYTTLALIVLYPRCPRDTDARMFAGREGDICYYMDMQDHEIYTENAR